MRTTIYFTHRFEGCPGGIEILDLEGPGPYRVYFDAPDVTYMGYMFGNCSSLASLDLSSFDAPDVTDMSSMFDGCNGLSTVKLGDKFKWVGTNGHLPTPSSSYIPGADGKWYAESDGAAYAPTRIPSGKADTYYASKGLLPSSDEEPADGATVSPSGQDGDAGSESGEGPATADGASADPGTAPSPSEKEGEATAGESASEDATAGDGEGESPGGGDSGASPVEGKPEDDEERQAAS